MEKHMQILTTRALLYHCAWGAVFGAAATGLTNTISLFSDSLVLVIAALLLLLVAMMFLKGGPGQDETIERRRSTDGLTPLTRK